MKRGSAAALSAWLSFSCSSGWASLTQIGAAAAVKGHVQRTTAEPGAVGRVMESGLSIYLNDKISTDAEGRMQVMLLDETVFTIGPNASMVLDEFVYDPAKGAGKISARITKGAFRFVTGRIAREQPSNMKIKLPVGVIGIRGTIVAGLADALKSTVVLLGPGPANNATEKPGGIAVANEGQTVDISQPGYASELTPGQAPSKPFEAPLALIDALAKAVAPAPKPTEQEEQGKGKSGGKKKDGKSAGELAGEATALGFDAAAAAADAAATSLAQNSVADRAIQDAAQLGAGFPDGLSTWEQVSTLSSLGTVNLTGIFFTMVGGVPCVAGPGQCDGSGSFSLAIDFAARSITGSGSFGAPAYGDSFLNLTPNPTLFSSGSALFSGPTGSGNGSYQFQFINSGGQAGKLLQGNFNFNDLSNSGSGTVTTPVH